MATDLFLCYLDLTRSVSLIFSLASPSELGGYTEDVTLALLKQGYWCYYHFTYIALNCFFIKFSQASGHFWTFLPCQPRLQSSECNVYVTLRNVKRNAHYLSRRLSVVLLTNQEPLPILILALNGDAFDYWCTNPSAFERWSGNLGEKEWMKNVVCDYKSLNWIEIVRHYLNLQNDSWLPLVGVCQVRGLPKSLGCSNKCWHQILWQCVQS